MAAATIYTIDDVNLVILSVEPRIDFYVEIAFGLKIRHQVALTFIDQILVYRILLIDGNEFSDCALPDSRALDANRNDRTSVDDQRQVCAIGFCIVGRIGAQVWSKASQPPKVGTQMVQGFVDPALRVCRSRF